MNERLMVTHFTLVDPTEGNAAGNLFFEALTDMVIVGISAAPTKDDAGAAIDIYDDGSAVIEDVPATDADVPGTWQARGYGGANAPVVIAKDSLVSIRPTDGAVATGFTVTISWLAGVDWR